MLRMKALDEAKSARALEAIDRSARAQAQLIDDLLDISRIVAGNLRVEIRRWTSLRWSNKAHVVKPIDAVELVVVVANVARPHGQR